MYCTKVATQLNAKFCEAVRAVVNANKKTLVRISEAPSVPLLPTYRIPISQPPIKVPGRLHTIMMKLLRYVVLILSSPVLAPCFARYSGRKLLYRGDARPIIPQIRRIRVKLYASLIVEKSARTWGKPPGLKAASERLMAAFLFTGATAW